MHITYSLAGHPYLSLIHKFPIWCFLLRAVLGGLRERAIQVRSTPINAGVIHALLMHHLSGAFFLGLLVGLGPGGAACYIYY